MTNDQMIQYEILTEQTNKEIRFKIFSISPMPAVNVLGFLIKIDWAEWFWNLINYDRVQKLFCNLQPTTLTLRD